MTPNLVKEICSVQDCQSFQSDIDNCYHWSSNSHLFFHVDKTFLVRFCSAKRTPIYTDYQLNGSSIQVKSSCRDLGVIFTSNLLWSPHIDKVLGRAYQSLYFIKRTFASATKRLAIWDFPFLRQHSCKTLVESGSLCAHAPCD